MAWFTVRSFHSAGPAMRPSIFAKPLLLKLPPLLKLWRDLPSSDYGMASKTAQQEEEGKRKVGSKNGATGRSDIEHVRSGIARVDGNAAR
jgi:hypothetical protein